MELYVSLSAGAMFLLWCVFWYFFFWYFSRPTASVSVEAHEDRFFFSLTVLVFIGVGFFYWFLWRDIGLYGRLPSCVADYVTVTLGWVGFVAGGLLMLWSRKSLSFLTSYQVLFCLSGTKTSGGPYRFFAHPMYVGYALVLIGSALVFLNAAAIAFAGAILFIFSVRAYVEKKHFARGD